MSLKKIKKNVLWFTGDLLLRYLITLLCKSLRVEVIGDRVIRNFVEDEEGFVVAFWHGSMLVPWYYLRSNKTAAMVSPSKDGDLLTKVLSYWKYKVVRGSSTKSGKDALNEMIGLIQNNFLVTITPDGPTGPVHQFKPGAVITAQRTGCPLMLVGVGYKKKRIFNSWDEFELPELFSRVKLVVSDPIYIESELSREETERKIKECESLLNKLQKEAQEFD